MAPSVPSHSVANITQTMNSVEQNNGIMAASFTGNQYQSYYGHSVERNNRPDAKILMAKVLISDPEVAWKHLRSSKEERVEGACEWIKDNVVYKSWQHNGTTLLRIAGGPDQGKMMSQSFSLNNQRKTATKQKTQSFSALEYLHWEFLNLKVTAFTRIGPVLRAEVIISGETRVMSAFHYAVLL
jgi:hypothetical protein